MSPELREKLQILQLLEEGGGDFKEVFGRLVIARLSEGKLALNDYEIIGNCFFFVFAYHGTAHIRINILSFLI